MRLIFLLALLISGLSSAANTCNLPFSIELKYKTVKKVGKQYRKTDVIIRIPVLAQRFAETKTTYNKKPEVKLEFSIRKDKALTYIQAIKPLNGELLLIQPIKHGFVYEEAHVKKIISQSPRVEEVFIVYPVDVKKNYISFPLPSLSLGEKLIIEYRYEGELGKPFVKYVKPSENRHKKNRVFLTVKYSFLFKYAQSRVNDENVKNIQKILDQLKNFGVDAKVEIIGYADGKSTNPKKNEEIAKKRALEIAKRIFPENILSCIHSSIPIVKLNR